VAEMGEESATHWYNFAAILFNHSEKLQLNEEAIKAINRAIAIKTKPRFQELKYLLLFTSGNMEEAKTLHPFLTDPGDKFKLMK
jgi:hypothetical protein